jgi:hypothetical protein
MFIMVLASGFSNYAPNMPLKQILRHFSGILDKTLNAVIKIKRKYTF